MSEEKQTKLKVKDLPESERNVLLKEMEAAGLRGVKTEYQVENAKAKIEEWKKSQNAENDEQQPPQENAGGGEQKTENVEQNDENVNKTPENVNETTKNVKKPAKKLICHICYGEVKDGVCTKCGFTLKRA